MRILKHTKTMSLKKALKRNSNSVKIIMTLALCYSTYTYKYLPLKSILFKSNLEKSYLATKNSSIGPTICMPPARKYAAQLRKSLWLDDFSKLFLNKMDFSSENFIWKNQCSKAIVGMVCFDGMNVHWFRLLTIPQEWFTLSLGTSTLVNKTNIISHGLKWIARWISDRN